VALPGPEPHPQRATAVTSFVHIGLVVEDLDETGEAERLDGAPG
jgi:hypothetical protein